MRERAKSEKREKQSAAEAIESDSRVPVEPKPVGLLIVPVVRSY